MLLFFVVSVFIIRVIQAPRVIIASIGLLAESPTTDNKSLMVLLSVVGKNIKELEESGHKKSQSIAIALDVARKAGAKTPKKGKK